MNCVPYLSICMCPDFFGNPLVSMTLVVLVLSLVSHYLHPLEPSIEQAMDHNLLQQIV